MKLIRFSFYAIFARLVRAGLVILGQQKKLDVAFISNYRDEVDVLKFGFWSVKNLPSVLSWTRYKWEGLTGRLFMIGSVTEQIAGDKSTKETLVKAQDQFIKAVTKAVNLGAKVILYAAATKRLFKKGELEALFPETIFTLGDNFTGLLLGERIKEAFQLSNIDFKTSRVLLIAPYGLLGGISLQYILRSGCDLICMGNPKRKDLLEKLAVQYKFKTAYNFEDVGEVDMVVACNSASAVQLIPERIEKIRKTGLRVIVIDPNEPQNMTPQMMGNSAGKVLRYDAGNGFSRRLQYILGDLSSSLLRLPPSVSWGCFCETFIIAKHYSELAKEDWYEISLKNIKLMYKFFGDKEGQFALPEPTCHTKKITSFDLEEKSRTKEIFLQISRMRFAEGLRMLF